MSEQISTHADMSLSEIKVVISYCESALYTVHVRVQGQYNWLDHHILLLMIAVITATRINNTT